MKTASRINMSSPDLGEEERRTVMEVLNTPVLSMGPQVEAFEKAFTSYTGLGHAVAVNSGTAGLHLCVRAAGIGAGDLVLTTPFSFVASANVLLFENAVPVFVDVDPQTGNIDPVQLAQAVEEIQTAQKAKKWLPRRQFIRGTQGHPGVDVFGQPDWDRSGILKRST
jgi:dTDP-4-amino-4,6-dideoxygalactose transaminase